MSQTIQDNILFETIFKDSGIRIGDTLIQSTWDPNSEYPSDNNFPLINAVDIDWNGAKVDENTSINTTGELINWIKSNILSEDDRNYLELFKQIVNIIRNNNNDSNLYWYAGTILPTASNIRSIGTGLTSKPSWTVDNQQDCTVTNNTGISSYIYYCFPADWNVTFYDGNNFNVGLSYVSNFTYNNINYKVERLGRKQVAQAIIPLFARC